MSSTNVTVEETKLLNFPLMTSSSSESESDIFQIETPRRKAPLKRRRRRKAGESHPSSIAHSLFNLRIDESMQHILKFLCVTFLLGVVIVETIMLVKLAGRLDRIERFHVDSDGKRVSEALSEISQRFEQIKANQTQFRQLALTLADRLEQMSKNVSTMGHSTEELREGFIETVNNQIQSHVKTMETTVEEIQSKLSSLSHDLEAVHGELSANEEISNTKFEKISTNVNSSIDTLSKVIAGEDTTSDLGIRFKSNLEDVIGKSKTESEKRLASSFNDTIREMKRELSSSMKTNELKPSETKPPKAATEDIAHQSVKDLNEAADLNGTQDVVSSRTKESSSTLPPPVKVP